MITNKALRNINVIVRICYSIHAFPIKLCFGKLSQEVRWLNVPLTWYIPEIISILFKIQVIATLTKALVLVEMPIEEILLLIMAITGCSVVLFLEVHFLLHRDDFFSAVNTYLLLNNIFGIYDKL